MFRRTHKTVCGMLLICLFRVVGLGAGLVLCYGSNGHLSVEGLGWNFCRQVLTAPHTEQHSSAVLQVETDACYSCYSCVDVVFAAKQSRRITAHKRFSEVFTVLPFSESRNSFLCRSEWVFPISVSRHQSLTAKSLHTVVLLI